MGKDIRVLPTLRCLMQDQIGWRPTLRGKNFEFLPLYPGEGKRRRSQALRCSVIELKRRDDY
jgi:hypothetical protein